MMPSATTPRGRLTEVVKAGRHALRQDGRHDVRGVSGTTRFGQVSGDEAIYDAELKAN